jgi:peptidyl-prolyl cis-trans isomerase A (cyclophilin A)
MKKTLLCIALTLFATNILAQDSADDAATKYPTVLIETSAGNFTVELFAIRAPLTVANFLKYVDSGFYTDTIFHRVVANFVVQGGGYDTNYTVKPTEAKVANESGNGLSNRREYIAMARTSEPHSADSQFYVNLADNSPLDPRPTRWGYTVFGRVTDGMHVIDEIGYQATGSGPNAALGRDVPAEQVVILSAKRIATAPVTPKAETEK